MPITSTGYDGSVDELVWAPAGVFLGAPRGVAGGDDFRVTVTGGTPTVAAGTAHGDGIVDRLDQAAPVTLDAAIGTVRYDAVVLRRDWSTNTTSLAVVAGGAVRVVPTVRDAPGLITDQPLALIQVTPGAAPVVADDLRVTYAPVGVAPSAQAMVGPLGSRYVLAGTGKRYVVGPSGAVPEWEPPAQQVPAIPRMAGGVSTLALNASGAAKVAHGLAWKPDVVIARPHLAGASALIEVYVSSDTRTMTASDFTVLAKMRTKDGWAPYTSGLTIDWIAVSFTPIVVTTVPGGVPDPITPTTPVDPGTTTPTNPGTTTPPPLTGGTVVPVDPGASPASQTPIPQTPPIYVAPVATTSSVQSILTTAAKEIGTTESPAGSNKVKYWLDEKPSWNGSYWCATFCCWVYRRNGINVNTVLHPKEDNPYYCPYLETAAKALGLWYTGTPRPGDMAIYGAKEAQHVEIVEKWIPETGRVQTIGGNTSDGVNGSPNNGGGVFRNIRNPNSSGFPVRGYIRMPTAVPSTLQVRGPYPLPIGHVYGTPKSATVHDGTGTGEAQAVMELQAELGATVDGTYGPATEALAKKWETAMFRTVDGKIDAGDWQVFAGTIVAPPAPTGVTVTPGNNSVVVAFTAANGAQQYTAKASSGQTVTGAKSPLTITGLTSGLPVTVTVAAANVGGASPDSARSAVVYPVEGGLQTVALNDSIIPVWAGSSKYDGAKLIGNVTTNIGDQNVYNNFIKAYPAARFTAGEQQMARNVCAILYAGAAAPAGSYHNGVKYLFSGVDSFAFTYSSEGTITMGKQTIGATLTASYMTHETVHLMQVGSPLYGDKYVFGVIEGIADYVLVVMGYHTVAERRPRDGGTNWYDGYDTTAFFFDYIVRSAPTPTPDFVRKLNLQMGSNTWTPAQITNINAQKKTVDQLWTDYRNWLKTQ